MKKIRKLSKKFSAGLLGVTLLASGAAAQNLGKLPQPFVDDDGALSSSIVVGEDAKTSDVVSAIDIATTLGNDAYSNTTQTVEGAGETTDVNGATSDVAIRGSLSSLSIDKSDYSNLVREVVTAEDDTDHYIVENVDVSGTGVDTIAVNDTVETTVSSNTVTYSASYSPSYDTDETITLLGEEYQVTGIDTGAGEVDLGSNMDQNGLEVGDSYTHGPYTVEVVDKDESNSEIYVSVSKDGNELKSQGLETGNTLTADDGQFELDADSVFFGSQRDYIDVTSTFSEYTLTDGEDSEIAPDYKTSLTFQSGKISKIKLSNQVKAVDKTSENLNEDEVQSLEAGDSFQGPQDYFTLTNTGLTNEATEDITFSEEYQVEYTDTEGFDQSLDIRKLTSATSPSLTSTNPWVSGNGVSPEVKFNDGGTSSTWESGSDIIVEDTGGTGTVSDSADPVLNSGSDSSTDTAAGATLKAMSDISSGTFFVVSSDSTFDEGEPVVRDDDNDGVYTGQVDTLVAGNTPSAGTSVTTANGQDTDWTISSIDNSDGDSWDSNADTLYEDADGDNAYTLQADNVLAGTDTNLATGDSLTDGGNLDTAWTGASAGDIMYYDASSGGAWDGSSDAIWVDNPGGTSDGQFVSADDNLLAGTAPGDNTGKSGDGVDSADWTTINVYDNSGSDDWDSGNDAIIEDFHDGKTYSTSQETVVAGNTPNDGATGATHTSNGFDGDWSLDSIDASGSGDWDAGTDSIIIDVGDRGTYSAAADTIVNGEGSANPSDGASIVDISTFTSPVKWSDLGTSGYNSGDEIISDDDQDGVYTSTSDNQIAGATLSSTNGNSLTTTNPFGSLKFSDSSSGGAWDSSTDLIAVDEDADDTYDSGDAFVAGTAPSGILDETENAKTLYTDVSGHPVKVDWAPSAGSNGEATLSYETFDTTIAPGESVSQSTGYGFTITADFNDLNSDSNADLSVSSADSTLDTQLGANIRYDSGNSAIDVEEDGDGSYDDLVVGYDGSNQVDSLDSTDFSSTTSETTTISDYGTKVDFEPEGSASFTYPENQLYATHAVGEVSTSQGGDSSYNLIEPQGTSEVGVLDSEADTSQDLILVGGPDVNDLTEDLAEQGDTWTGDQYTEGEGLLQMVSDAFNSGYDALVVAGQTAEDTTAAGNFLADYDENLEDLEGKSQVVVDSETGELIEE